MPKKRRHKPQRSHPRQSGHPGRRQGQADVADRLEVELPILLAVDEAEARGDALAALELIEDDLATRTDELFWRPERVRRLWQLALLGSLAPRWVTSRWILDQACQHLDPRLSGQSHKAIDVAVETRGGEETLRGRDPFDARVKVVDHDWIYRQLFLYEFGALRNFVTRVAAPDLLAGADQIEAWMRTPMGAFRLVEETPTSLTLVDLGSGEEVSALNLGAASMLLIDECAIGRLVPIEGGAMFESAPLYVPDPVAERVAADPGEWVAALATGCRDARSQGIAVPTVRQQFGLVTDVPSSVRLEVAQRVHEQVSGELLSDVDPPEESCEFARRLVRAALDEPDLEVDWESSPWPIVAAALLQPHVFVTLPLVEADAPKLRRLADRLAGPAGAVCRELALEMGEAA